jgi:hypothetical protein
MSTSAKAPVRDPGKVGADALRELGAKAAWEERVRSVCDCGAVRYADALKTLQNRFRQLEEREGLTATELAERLGRYRSDRGKRRPDGDWAMVTLGLKREPQRNGGRAVRYTIRDEAAIELGRAMHLDPQELGL